MNNSGIFTFFLLFTREWCVQYDCTLFNSNLIINQIPEAVLLNIQFEIELLLQ